ncbi:hypothetical protein LNO88_09215 [Klebsiella pneumoniae subsp. pneumoniae]|nr:hypothetical protein [Klebsiella pneumoniae subsp. pneumoniae]
MRFYGSASSDYLPHTFHVGVFGEEVCGDTQRTGTARCLRGAGAFISDNRIAFTEQQLLGAATKFRNTIDAQIVLVVSFSSRYCSAF